MAADPEGEELERLRRRLAEAEDALHAIRTGEIDAIVVQGPTGPVVYSLKTADTPYRLLVEQMHEGALTVSTAGVIMYANAAFAGLVGMPLEQLRGRYGKTVSALRPAGVVEFDGKRVDCLSEGTMIDPDQWVKCIDVKTGTVIVRQVERPPDLGNMDGIDLT